MDGKGMFKVMFFFTMGFIHQHLQTTIWENMFGDFFSKHHDQANLRKRWFLLIWRKLDPDPDANVWIIYLHDRGEKWPHEQGHMTVAKFIPEPWVASGKRQKVLSKSPRSSQASRQVASYFGTLRIIGPWKLAILRTLHLLYRFKPFHWRVQDP